MVCPYPVRRTPEPAGLALLANRSFLMGKFLFSTGIYNAVAVFQILCMYAK